MKLSLQARVSILITLVIVAVGIASTFLFTTAHSRSKEKGMIARGTALSYILSHAAEEGLANEDLDLIKKASYVIKAPDVVLTQVYSDLWEAIDAYPLTQLKSPPHPGALEHFRNSDKPFYVKIESGYDFYAPVTFRATDGSTPIGIGFGRIVLSSFAIRQELREIIFTNVGASVVITMFAVMAINILISRLVVRPVVSLYKSVSMFKEGVMPDDAGIPLKTADEIRELSLEFKRMCRTVKEKESSLIESERRIKSLFERVDHAIFRIDANGSIIDANSRFRQMFGEVKALCEILIGEGGTRDCLNRAASSRLMHVEDKAVGRRGEEFTISLSLYPDTDTGGNISGFDGYIIDVTERKRLEERLMRSQKMEAVGTLAGGMAHDFNNLLTAILGYSEIILSMTKEGDEFNKPATIIYDAAKRGAEFGRKILSITRKEKIETKPVNINDIVRTSLDLLQRSIPKNIDIITRLDDAVPFTKADPSQVQQVIINLAVNGRDAMPEGGKLTIETALVGKENGVAGMLKMEGGGFIRLSVSDTGIGIDKETQAKIFDPFFTTKDLGKGTGLGLYIVHSIVNNHGGYINLYSEPFKGTQFNIYLPVTTDMDSTEPCDLGDIRGAGTVLVIDDEADVRELCRDMLEPLGYTILLASSGSTGINIYREMKEKISLVVLDMIMPRMGGNEVFRALRNIKPDIRVLLCSGYSQSGFAGIDELLNQGAAGFIQKPFTRHAIALAIKKALSE